MSSRLHAAFTAKSRLTGGVCDGLRALAAPHRGGIHPSIRGAFSASLDVDAGLRPEYPRENRWDYLLALGTTGPILGLEPHSASTGEVSVVIDKKKAAQRQLRGHLKEGVRIERWFWVASGDVAFAPFEKAIRRLEENGVTFVGKQLAKKHLDGL